MCAFERITSRILSEKAFLFGPLKEALGQKFDNDTSVEVFVHNWLHSRQPSLYDSGIKKLSNRWEKCVSKSGNYVEK